MQLCLTCEAGAARARVRPGTNAVSRALGRPPKTYVRRCRHVLLGLIMYCPSAKIVRCSSIENGDAQPFASSAMHRSFSHLTIPCLMDEAGPPVRTRSRAKEFTSLSMFRPAQPKTSPNTTKDIKPVRQRTQIIR